MMLLLIRTKKVDNILVITDVKVLFWPLCNSFVIIIFGGPFGGLQAKNKNKIFINNPVLSSAAEQHPYELLCDFDSRENYASVWEFVNLIFKFQRVQC
jgi:hypothetical protein